MSTAPSRFRIVGGHVRADLTPREAMLLAAAIDREWPAPDAAQWDAVELRALAAEADAEGEPT